MYQKQPLEVFCKKCVLKNFAYFTRKHLCWSLFLIKLQDFRHAETPTQVLYRKICKISKNSYFEHLRATASGIFKILSNIYVTLLNVFFYFKKKCFVLKIIRLFYFVLVFSRYFFWGGFIQKRTKCKPKIQVIFSW